MNQNYMNSICYIILVKNEELTEFNKYSVNMLDKINILEKISTLPKDISELFYDKEHLISNRISGVFNGYNVKCLSSSEFVNESPFNINVVFISSILEIKAINRDVIFLSDTIKTNKEFKIYNIGEIGKYKLLKLVNDLVSGLDRTNKNYFKELETTTFYDEKSEFIDLDDIYAKSLYTRSNLSVLNSIKIKYSFENYGFEFKLDHQREVVERILSIKNHILKSLYPPTMLPNIDFLLSDMSSNLEFLINKSEYSERALANEIGDSGKSLAEAIKLINQNKIPNKFSENKYLHIYSQERLLIESLIALLSSNNVAVNIKLPISNSSVYSKLKDIGVVDRSGNKNKINKLMLRLVNTFKDHADGLFDYLDKKYSSNIKLVSDLPIEWSHHEGLPLMVRHEVSRIPISPGDVSTPLLLDSEQIILKADNFKKLKIISSFADGDPIKEHLKTTVDFIISQLTIPESEFTSLMDGNHMTKGKVIDSKNENLLDISIEWDNVSTLEDLTKSLRDNDSAITIFDLHGGHSENGSGVLKLKDELVSVYDLIGKVKISPIVILSSCDTSPIDRNHNSTANAFFLAGAKTVLASALPILSREASIFIARLLLRIKYYLPQRLNDNSGISIRWSSFVTGMIRRTFYSELLAMLEKKSLIKKEEKKHLLFHVGLLIDPLHSDWHEKILTEISKKVGISCTDLKVIMEKEFMMPECLKYIQLGNPELIIIAAKEHIPLVVN